MCADLSRDADATLNNKTDKMDKFNKYQFTLHNPKLYHGVTTRVCCVRMRVCGVC